MLNEELLQQYLALSHDERKKRFVNTARAAEISGLSRRTIQLWIEMNHIQAISVGKKYQIDLNSLNTYIKAQHEKRNSENYC